MLRLATTSGQRSSAYHPPHDNPLLRIRQCWRYNSNPRRSHVVGCWGGGRRRNPFIVRTTTTSASLVRLVDALLSSAGPWPSSYDATTPPPPAALLLAQSSSTTTMSVVMAFVRRVTRRLKSWMRSFWDVVVLTIRGTEVVLRLSPLAVLTPAAVLLERQRRFTGLSLFGSSSNRLSDVAWWYALHAAQALGPVAIKSCQWAATRPDVFPPDACRRLARLHDRARPHPWRHTHRALSEAFGADYDTRGGLSVDPRRPPIGCGSAAQVHRGTLTTTTRDGKTTTRSVAVKVLHPRFQTRVRRDLRVLQTAADWLHGLPYLRMMNLPRVASNFTVLLQAQSDLTIEADHLRRFRRNFYGHNDDGDGDDEASQSSITFPRPLWSSTNVLVEDLVPEARPIAEFLDDDSEHGQDVRKQLAGPLLRAFLKMIFIDNFTHGDLHPGNVLVQTREVPVDDDDRHARRRRAGSSSSSWWWPLSLLADHNDDDFNSNKVKTATADNDDDDAKDSSRPPEKKKTTVKRTIVFLDAGIATRLDPDDQRNLRDLFRAVILNRGEEAGRLMVERAKYERCSETPGGVDAFAAGIGSLVAEFHDSRRSGLTLGAVRIGSLLSRVLDLCRVHGVEIDPNMASIVVSTLVLEGLGRALEPSLNLMDFAMPFVLGRGRV